MADFLTEDELLKRNQDNRQKNNVSADSNIAAKSNAYSTAQNTTASNKRESESSEDMVSLYEKYMKPQPVNRETERSLKRKALADLIASGVSNLGSFVGGLSGNNKMYDSSNPEQSYLKSIEEADKNRRLQMALNADYQKGLFNVKTEQWKYKNALKDKADDLARDKAYRDQQQRNWEAGYDLDVQKQNDLNKRFGDRLALDKIKAKQNADKIKAKKATLAKDYITTTNPSGETIYTPIKSFDNILIYAKQNGAGKGVLPLALSDIEAMTPESKKYAVVKVIAENMDVAEFARMKESEWADFNESNDVRTPVEKKQQQVESVKENDFSKYKRK